VRETSIGPFLVIEEPSGEATVYKNSGGDWDKRFSNYDEAEEWAHCEAELREAEKHDS
jgi:hypothetical protein